MDLTTRYMGLDLKNPLVASASPLNADLGNLKRLEDVGTAAVILPSLFEEQIEAETARREHLTGVNAESSPEAQSYFPAPTDYKVGPRQYLDLVRRASGALDIPVIASLNGTTDHGWISYAKSIEEAGAAGLELNIYFIPANLSLTGYDVEQRYLAACRTGIFGVGWPRRGRFWRTTTSFAVGSAPFAVERSERGRFRSLLCGRGRLGAGQAGARTNIRLRFHAMVTRLHSARTLSRPRNENWRNPSADLMMPNTGSGVCLRKA
jgi:hypothetical protein